MAVPSRALPLLALALASLPACGNKPGPEDPAITAASGIPMGAPNAAGVQFDASAARVPSPPAEIDDPDEMPSPQPLPITPDPFEAPDPPPMKEHGGAPPAAPKPPKKGMQL